MPRRIEIANGRNYVFSSDGSPPAGDRFWALAKVRVIDELSGGPPAGTRLISRQHGVNARMNSDGMGAAVGIPRDVFPHLDSKGYGVQLTVDAEGYVTQDIEVPVAIDLQFPKRFVPPALVDIVLHREPTVILGRTVSIAGNSTSPMGGATVRVTGIWRTPPPNDVAVPASPPNIVSLRPPLYAGRQAISGHLQRRKLPPAAGDKLLLEDVSSGRDVIRLSDRQSLAAGDILVIDGGRPDRVEFIAIKSINGAATVDQPASVVLDHRLAYEHRRDALVQKANPQPPGAVRQLSVEALAGDVCVFLNNLAGLAGASEVEINGGSANEYHSVSRFVATSDSDGYYRLPPLSRVAQVLIEGQKIVGPQTFAAKTEFRPDYSRRENTLDLTLTV